MSGARHIHLQPLGGVAGDMFVAALLDAFPEHVARVRADVAAVLPREAGAARLERVTRHGIGALHFSLAEAGADQEQAREPGQEERARRYRPRRGGAPAIAAMPRAAAAGPRSGTYRALRELIAAAPLAEGTADQAAAILRILAEAEATIHGVPLDDVHFHELADWDSLMDVVAAGSVIAALAPATWSLDALPLGGGRVATQHGPLAVPAPATARILQGYPWHDDGVAGERVTPTGAAIVRHLVPPAALGRRPQGILLASGYGAGTRRLAGMANVLRALAFDAAGAGDAAETRVAAVQFDIDDMTGEEIGLAADRLRDLPGVLDLALVQAQGKRGRPVTQFQLLVATDALRSCSEAIFAETSTIGLRWAPAERIVLPRGERRGSGGARIKEVVRPDGTRTRKMESEDLRAVPGLSARRALKSRQENLE
ncbi:MAG TPA: LarC family nickel insertion protein [Candidatus Desulfobacillus sp.]|nr:LarC family nickel insertion protein [Candidatus Desulfobacillus sp.]